MKVTLVLKGETLQQPKPVTPMNKLEVDCHPTTEVSELMQKAWEAFAVPLEGQVLYLEKKKLSPEAKLSACGVRTGRATIGVCGKQLRMAQEDVDAFVAQQESKLGGLRLTLLAKAGDKKALLGVGEQCHRAMEGFDGLSIPPAHTAFRAARKKYTREYSELLGRVDAAVAKL
eukprot:TRINITY_DN14956_c1_g1_i1.p3 TRINITY_DN14956_c1_g1~~TRINITY_DN14956_c1_g1_i1.p3  ORF type:complete len:173 (+),score=86.85 TRINITY_DN14956_c1_g1_i1:91-609(+)